MVVELDDEHKERGTWRRAYTAEEKTQQYWSDGHEEKGAAYIAYQIKTQKNLVFSQPFIPCTV